MSFGFDPDGASIDSSALEEFRAAVEMCNRAVSNEISTAAEESFSPAVAQVAEISQKFQSQYGADPILAGVAHDSLSEVELGKAAAPALAQISPILKEATTGIDAAAAAQPLINQASEQQTAIADVFEAIEHETEQSLLQDLQPVIEQMAQDLATVTIGHAATRASTTSPVTGTPTTDTILTVLDHAQFIYPVAYTLTDAVLSEEGPRYLAAITISVVTMQIFSHSPEFFEMVGLISIVSIVLTVAYCVFLE